MIEAARFNVLPLDIRSGERFNSDIAGRPVLVRGTSQTLYHGMKRLGENTVLNLKNKSHTITAQLEVPDSGANGVIIAQGGSSGGWSLYAKDGQLVYCYNLLGVTRSMVRGNRPIPEGAHEVRAQFAYDGGGTGKGATITLVVDGDRVGAGYLESTIPFTFSLDETMDVGLETGSPVSDEYGPSNNRFSGTVKWVKLDVDSAESDEHIDVEHRLHAAMVRQ